MRFPLLLCALLLAMPARADVVALTFDACEDHGKPAYFDQGILDYLAAEKLPAPDLAAEGHDEILLRRRLVPAAAPASR